MKHSPGLIRFAALVITTLGLARDLSGQPLGTAFTYQGRLADASVPANGTYDLEFRLFDALTSGGQVGSLVTANDVVVASGLFTVRLDFGAVFAGSARFLQIGVRPGASGGAYTTLGTRQELTPAPNSVFAATSGSAAAVTGTIPVTNGGTGAGTAAAARVSLGAAKNGANTDITSLSGLTALQLTTGAAADKVLISDAAGNASWQVGSILLYHTDSSFAITNTSPTEVGATGNFTMPAAGQVLLEYGATLLVTHAGIANQANLQVWIDGLSGGAAASLGNNIGVGSSTASVMTTRRQNLGAGAHTIRFAAWAANVSQSVSASSVWVKVTKY